MSITPVYEKTNLDDAFCHVDTIQLNEFNDTIYNTGYTYSGITLVFNLSNFTTHFNTTGHTYLNTILNNDVYTYTGLTGETHYFYIQDFYSGATPYIDPRLSGTTEEEILSGFTTSLISCVDKLDGLTGTCCPTQVILHNIPWIYQTNYGNPTDHCLPFIQRRPEEGRTLDFVFNKNGETGWTESVFYYEGVRDEYEPENYGDNNLSFAFTSDGRIKWTSYRYSGYCDTVSGYTPIYYVETGQTVPLCPNGTLDDFNITITFERNYPYSGCSLANEGGWNDLIVDTSIILEGSTIIGGEMEEVLNQKWMNERYKRLGVLKIYHNGRPLEIDTYHNPKLVYTPVYKFKLWEELILSNRGFQPFVNAIGGGVTGSGNLHNTKCCYTIKYVGYFEQPMKYVDVRSRYEGITRSNFNIVECNGICIDDIVSLNIADAILTDDYLYYLLTNDGIYYIKQGI